MPPLWLNLDDQGHMQAAVRRRSTMRLPVIHRKECRFVGQEPDSRGVGVRVTADPMLPVLTGRHHSWPERMDNDVGFLKGVSDGP